ncbi:MAG: hypothetical protein JJW01_00945 [Alphaproteobacteria bacterium]|nr:hypothetical protein [Rickettsiales bacterium]
MTLIICENSAVICYDCNITDKNENGIFSYLQKVMPKDKKNIDVFIASHRDKDHINGIEKLNKKYNISQIWDSGQYKSEQEDNNDYQDYMTVKKNAKKEINPTIGQTLDAGATNIICLNTFRKDEKDPNTQSIVIKISHKNKGSVLLTGDTDAYVWKEYIMKENKDKVSSAVLLGSHHGSITFFDDTRGTEHCYTSHLKEIAPKVVIVSVGENSHGHPKPKALEIYENNTKGTNNKNKICRTDKLGSMKVKITKEGWSLYDEKGNRL